MARTSIDYDTRTPTARKRLTPRGTPYTRQIAPGKLLGYFRREDKAGSWAVLEWTGRGYKQRTLGNADDVTRADGLDVLTFDQAQRKATNPALGAPIPARKLTVRHALDTYFTALAGKSVHAEEYRAGANKHIVPVLGDYRVDRITKTQIEDWQAGMVRDDPEDPDARRRSQDSANRVRTMLMAALNAAFQDEANGIPTDAAWRRVKPFKKVARARDDDLDPADVRLLIAKAATFDQALANLMEGGYLTGARLPGEFAGVDVSDFDAANRRLSIRTGKTGARTVTLTNEAIAFFSRLAKGRKPDDPLFPRADGTRWPRTGHFRWVKRAVELAKLPLSVSLYTLRHAHISRAIDAGMPLSLIAANCGTSLLMIQNNYAKVLARTREDMIQKTSPKLRAVK